MIRRRKKMLSPFNKSVILKVLMALSATTESNAIVMIPNQRLELSVAREGMTRITVENDGIDDIYVFPEEYGENIQKHASGHLFVVGEGVTEPVSLTIITRRNIVQDLHLTFKSQKSEPIILTYSDPESKIKEDKSKISKIMKSFLVDQVPSGFLRGQPHEVSRSRGDLEATAIASYRNHEYVVTEFIVKNHAQKKISLHPATMWSEGDLALVFNSESLDFSLVGESDEAKMFVIRKS